MTKQSYRVVQWATGNVGKVALRRFIENPVFELAVLVTNPDKVGRDAGELIDLAPVGVIATDDVEAIVALDADCVHFAPSVEDVDMICPAAARGQERRLAARAVSIPPTSTRTRSRPARASPRHAATGAPRSMDRACTRASRATCCR